MWNMEGNYNTKRYIWRTTNPLDDSQTPPEEALQKLWQIHPLQILLLPGRQ